METTYFSSEPVRMIMGAVFILLIYLFFTGSEKTKQWCVAVVLLIAVACMVIVYFFPPIPGMSFSELLVEAAITLGKLLLIALGVLIIGTTLFFLIKAVCRQWFNSKYGKNNDKSFTM